MFFCNFISKKITKNDFFAPSSSLFFFWIPRKEFWQTFFNLFSPFHVAVCRKSHRFHIIWLLFPSAIVLVSLIIWAAFTEETSSPWKKKRMASWCSWLCWPLEGSVVAVNTVYWKPMHTEHCYAHCYLQCDSTHHPRQKHALVKTLVDQALCCLLYTSRCV